MKHRPFVLLATLVFAMAACSGSDDATTTTGDQTTEVATTSPATIATTTVPDTTVSATSEAQDSQADVFSFADDDLCEWVSEAEIAEWVAAEFDLDGTASEVGTTDAVVACEWTIESTDGEEAVVTAGDAALWRGFDGDIYDFTARMADAGVIEYPPPQGSVEIGGWVVGHPAVSDDVVVHNGGFGRFAFGVPPGPWLQVSIYTEDGDENWDKGVAYEEYEAHYFALVDRFLRELGWVS